MESLTGPRHKLSSSDIAALRTAFCSKYTSEFLRPEVMPSAAFLFEVKEMTGAKLITWVPWRHRTSEADECAFLERRKPRTDRQLVASLLGEAPEEEFLASVPSSGPLESAIRRFCELFANALALLDACHLLQLRKLQEKFISLAIAQPTDRSLRSPVLTEVVEADRSTWLEIAALQRDHGWSLQDAVAELTMIRPHMHTALAPRVKAHQPPPPPQGTKRKADARRKQPTRQSSKQTSPKKGNKDRVSVSNWPSNWVRQVGGVGACIRFHTEQVLQVLAQVPSHHGQWTAVWRRACRLVACVHSQH